MFESIIIANKKFEPALFLAPMAGITNSAFRRLISDFGNYGALFTEMLAGTSFLNENIEISPYTRTRDSEENVICQFQLNGEENIDSIIRKFESSNFIGIDLNLGCPAPNIRNRGAGSSLFSDIVATEEILNRIRSRYEGLFMVKIRLGVTRKSWKKHFENMLGLFEKYRVDAITIHPRFAKEKLKRKADWTVFSKSKELTDIPIIGNGDIVHPSQIDERFSSLSGLMIGRAAIVKPWIFKSWNDTNFKPDYTETWNRYLNYLLEDFPPEKAIGRIKEFSSFYANNFFYGHTFFSKIQGSQDIDTLRNEGTEFLSNSPKLSKEPLNISKR